MIDGDDLSRYDDAIDRTVTNDEDLKALDQLDWELASEAGMVTGIYFPLILAFQIYKLDFLLVFSLHQMEPTI